MDDSQSSVPMPDALRFWREFGFEPLSLDPIMNCTDLAPVGHTVGCAIPAGVIAFTVMRADARDMGSVLDGYPVGGMLALSVGDRNYYYFRVDEEDGAFVPRPLPPSVQLLRAGVLVPLPENPQPSSVASLSEVANLAAQSGWLSPAPAVEPEILNSPLASYSLRGRADEFERLATEAKPLLGELCLTGQATIWYAPPNAGKTLITLKLLIDAVAEGRINPANAYYINADDSSAGFAAKMRLMDDIGVHTLSPGFKNLEADKLKDILMDVAARDKARGTLIILDTVKKFVSLMDKGKSSSFNQVCRQVVMRGGSILGLAHTNKNPSNSGKLRYAGTTDMIDDFDAAYLMTPVESDRGGDEKIVLFEALKRRGDNAQQAAYAYAGEGDISYEERLTSVRLVDHAFLDDLGPIEQEKSDADLIAAILSCIDDGVSKKMALAKAAAARAKVSERSALRVIEAYTGDDPSQHHWTCAIRERGAKVYTPLPSPIEEAPPLAA